MIQLQIDMIPVPWAASKVGKKGHFNPKGKEKAWCRWQIKNAYSGYPIEGFVILDCLFVEPPPASASKKEREKMLSGEIRPTRCDNTNMQKFTEDCLKNILFNDDRYVCKNISEKIYGDKGKILIKVYSLEEYRTMNANCIGYH